MNHTHDHHDHAEEGDSCCSAPKPHLSEKQAIAYLQYLTGWVILEDKGVAKLNKTYSLLNFRQGIQFLEQIEVVTREFNHHPVVQLQMSSISITWHTFSAQGLTDLDFASAEACDTIFEEIK